MKKDSMLCGNVDLNNDLNPYLVQTINQKHQLTG